MNKQFLRKVSRIEMFSLTLLIKSNIEQHLVTLEIGRESVEDEF